jgi:predicted TIM-barrel fold metal-dependent hydrolase
VSRGGRCLPGPVRAVIPWAWRVPERLAEGGHGDHRCLDAASLGGVLSGPDVRFPAAPGRPIPYLDTVALEFPELVIVGGHIGYPWTAEMISLATKYPNVYIDTSAYKASRYPRELVDYLRGHGRHKVLFGSNHPAWPAADCLADLPRLQLDDQTTDLFLHGNAQRVFGFADPPAPA